MYHAYYRVLVILCFSLSKVSNLVFPDRLIGYFLFIIKKKKILSAIHATKIHNFVQMFR